MVGETWLTATLVTIGASSLLLTMGTAYCMYKEWQIETEVWVLHDDVIIEPAVLGVPEIMGQSVVMGIPVVLNIQS